MRLAAQAKGGYYPTPTRVATAIFRLIETPYGYSYRRLRSHPSTRPLRRWRRRRSPLRVQPGQRHPVPRPHLRRGAAQERAEDASELLDHTLNTDLFQTSIANRAFSILYLNPPYDFDNEDKRTEQAFLAQCTRYLTENGLLIFIVPRLRLKASAAYLAANYTRLNCYAFPDPEREAFDQVVLFGYRKLDNAPNPHAARRIPHWIAGDAEPLPDRPYPQFYVPPVDGGDILFTTRTIDPTVAAQEARQNGLWQSVELGDLLWPTSTAHTRPLMPLKRGHLAMLVAAGFLDNLVLESEDQRILVKGRTTKDMVLVDETPNKEIYREQMKTTIVSLDLQTGDFADITA